MMEPASTLSTLIVGGASGAGACALLALLLRLLFKREAENYARLDARIVLLEAALQAEQHGHMECVKELGIMQGRVDQLTQDLDLSIRRHDLRTQDQIKMNVKRIVQLEEYMRQSGIEPPPFNEEDGQKIDRPHGML